MQFDDLLAEHDAQKSALDAAASAAVVPAAAAAAAMPGIDPAKVPKMTVKVLKEELSSRGETWSICVSLLDSTLLCRHCDTADAPFIPTKPSALHTGCRAGYGRQEGRARHASNRGPRPTAVSVQRSSFMCSQFSVPLSKPHRSKRPLYYMQGSRNGSSSRGGGGW
eukprot:SAG11_NODE_682_length_7769_cov_45.167275_9_plen_166_part_00